MQPRSHCPVQWKHNIPIATLVRRAASLHGAPYHTYGLSLRFVLIGSCLCTDHYLVWSLLRRFTYSNSFACDFVLWVLINLHEHILVNWWNVSKVAPNTQRVQVLKENTINLNTFSYSSLNMYCIHVCILEHMCLCMSTEARGQRQVSWTNVIHLIFRPGLFLI